MSGLPDGRVVLVEDLAIGEDEPHVVAEVLSGAVGARLQLALDGGNVHWAADDLAVGGELLGVHREEERPRVVARLHLGHQDVARGEVALGAADRGGGRRRRLLMILRLLGLLLVLLLGLLLGRRRWRRLWSNVALGVLFLFLLFLFFFFLLLLFGFSVLVGLFVRLLLCVLVVVLRRVDRGIADARGEVVGVRGPDDDLQLLGDLLLGDLCFLVASRTLPLASRHLRRRTRDGEVKLGKTQ